ncbi:MAG TPA: histidine kinase dimerization/phospho-acceptor domain-containing protein, partial [Actinomycetota bacterium]|nr:histidine kinase dimerization/phospho-acceptor domain-containing protein [Actinomycetota bacterium]
MANRVAAASEDAAPRQGYMDHDEMGSVARRGPGTELNATLRELRALETRFHSIIQSMADGIVVVDRDGLIRFVNSSAEQLFGRDAEDLVGRPFGHPLVADETTEIHVLRGDGTRTAELRVVDTDWDGGTARVVSLRDVTDRMKAEEQARELIREQAARAEAEQAAHRAEFLAEAGRRLSTTLDLDATLQTVTTLVVEELADYCVVDLVDQDGTRRFTAARIGGERKALLREAEHYPLDPASDTVPARVYQDRNPVLVQQVDDDWLRQAARGEDHLDLIRSIGPTSLILVPLATGRECLGVLTAGCTHTDRPFDRRDMHLAAEIARRAALAIENARLYRDAEAANRAKANFLSVMSHELRTPLSAVIGYTDLIERGVVGEVTEEQRRFLGRIRASSNHLLQIIEEILAFAGTEMGEDKRVLEDTTLGVLMDDVLAV